MKNVKSLKEKENGSCRGTAGEFHKGKTSFTKEINEHIMLSIVVATRHGWL